jgi:hypothetical protein
MAVKSWSEDVHRPFILALNRFQESLIALRQLHGAIGPLLKELQDTHFDDEMRETLKGLDDDEVKVVREFLAEVTPGLISGQIAFGANAGDVGGQAQEKASDAEGRSDEPKQGEVPSWTKVVETLGSKSETAIEALALTYRANLGPSRAFLMRGSLLTSAIGAFEALLVDLAIEYYLLNPGAMGEDPKFSLKQLEEFDSLADAKLDAALRKAEDVTRGDVEDWGKWLEDHPGVKLKTHCVDFKRLYEIFQRRHIHVHNGGFVSRRYRERMLKTVGSSPELGAFLDVDDEYLEAAFDEIETVGNLIAANVWTKCLPDQEPAAMFELYQRSYDLLLDGRWQSVVKICSMAKLGTAEESLRTIHRVNEFVGRKMLGEDISAELAEWDVSALGPRFKLAKACLQGDLAAIDQALPTMLAKEEIRWPEIEEWPMLSDYRADPRFEVLARRHNEGDFAK